MFTIKKFVAAIAAIVALAGALALALPATALAGRFVGHPVEWSYLTPGPGGPGGNPTQPRPGVAYELYDNVRDQVLVYGARPLPAASDAGAQTDLKFEDFNGSTSQAQWEFRRQALHPRTGAITGGERVALYNRSIGRYLVRVSQTNGIKLDYSVTPTYEWQVAAGLPDTYVGGSNDIELYNTSEQAYLGCGWVWAFPQTLGWLHQGFTLPPGYQAPPPYPFAAPVPTAGARL